VYEFGGLEKLKLEDVPDLRPGAGEVLVRIHAAGVNPVDTYIRSGTHSIKPSLPYRPGIDGAGTVVSTGEGMRRFRAGDRVYLAGSVSGTYAQQALARESQVHPLPAKVSFQQGAAMGVPYGTAYRALFQRAHTQPGETVLIHGASGGVGIAATQLAHARGITVIGTAGSDQGRALVRENGAQHVLDHTKPDVGEQMMKLTAGSGVNVILEMMAHKNLGKDLSLLSRNGRVVVVGNRGTIEINPRDAMARDASIIGMVLFNTSEQEMASIHAALGAALENGTARPVIGQEFPLAEAARAHEAVMQPGRYGKIVLIA
jgi:NADPH2:quinone reductase